MGNLYHYGTHEEVKDFWKERGQEFGEMMEGRKEGETSPFPDYDPVTGTKYGVAPKPKGYVPGSEWIRPELARGYIAPTKAAKPKKRKISKSNKAMSGLYKFLLKEQKGKMTQAKSRKLLGQCAKIAGKANPATKSRIGKGNSKKQKLMRKTRKKYWNTTRRY